MNYLTRLTHLLLIAEVRGSVLRRGDSGGSLGPLLQPQRPAAQAVVIA
jgi:hypothetical protein